jgi:hypothetical protein
MHMIPVFHPRMNQHFMNLGNAGCCASRRLRARGLRIPENGDNLRLSVDDLVVDAKPELQPYTSLQND